MRAPSLRNLKSAPKNGLTHRLWAKLRDQALTTCTAARHVKKRSVADKLTHSLHRDVRPKARTPQKSKLSKAKLAR